MTLCAVVLAAGEGTRLRPLTLRVPKALCPVGNIPLLDHALARLADIGVCGQQRVAVNACYLAEQIVHAAAGRAHLSVEPPPALGTSGGVANLRDWIAGRAVLVCNADAYLAGASRPDLVGGWDGETVRLLVVPATQDQPGEFGNPRRWRFAGMSLLPWRVVRKLPLGPSGLVSTVWRPAEVRGDLELVRYPGRYLDCGTPSNYLAANLLAVGHGSLIHPAAQVRGRVVHSVVGAAATVEGELTRSVVWPGGYVGPGEHLINAIRADQGITVATRG